MKKEEYIRECLKRNPELRGDVLSFYQQFPPVFIQKVRSDYQPPDWLSSIIKPAKDLKNVFIGCPNTLKDLGALDSTAVDLEGLESILPEDKGNTYWDAIQKTPTEWVTAYYELRQKWPRLNKATLLWGVGEPYRPSLIVAGLPFNSEAWERDLASLSHGVKMVIPIYEDTCADDVDWRQIANLQNYLYEKKRRATPGNYEKKLRVWDIYQRIKTLKGVSEILRMPKSTVQRLYNSVERDILGLAPGEKPEERGILDVDIPSHVQRCFHCRTAKSFDQMCEHAKAYIEQDHVAIRELTASKPGTDPEKYEKSPRKKTHPGSDKYQEKEGKSMLKLKF